MLEIRHLRTLIALADGGSVSRAAERLHLTQSALSHQLRALESHYGLAVVRRKGQTVELTEAGERMLELAQKVVADIQTAFNATGVLGTSAVACAVASTKNMTITFSGAGYAGLPQTLITVDNSAATGGCQQVSMVRTTTGVDGRFKAGSVASQNDGSQTPATFLPDGFPMEVTDSAGSVAQLEFPHFPIGGIIDPSTFIGWSAMDASLKTYVKNQLSSILGGKYVFKDAF